MKILAVCGFGCGSSMILRLSIEKVLLELGVNAEVENTDLSGARVGDSDLILTSEEFKKELENDIDTPIITVFKYVDTEEIKNKLIDFLGK